jgi:excinuclease ABC subunit A
LLVGSGTPQDLMDNPASHTGAALRDYDANLLLQAPAAVQTSLAEPGADYGTPLQSVLRERRLATQAVEIHNAREHNLKNISVDIPRDTFTVITGVSGSGKSTLAFDILFNEGQRRYLESLNAYVRAIVQTAGKPDVDAIFGIPPTVAIEQRTSRGGRKSTVATMTEIHHFLRLLYVKLGTQYCPDCEVAVEPQNTDQIVARLLREHKGKHIGLLAPLVTARKGYYTGLAK